MEKEIKYQIKPSFNFIYEIFMPLGIKLRRNIVLILTSIILFIIVKVFGAKFGLDTNIFGMNILDILNWFFIIFALFFLVKLIVDIVFKILQYKNINYTFYEDNLVYEDNFLNQQRKVIKYENIKEVEIRRTIFDRIMGYGIIIISTNAEGNFRSGLIIYGTKNPNEAYERINELVHSKDWKNINKQVEIKPSENISDIKTTVENNSQDEEDFKDSLKNVK